MRLLVALLAVAMLQPAPVFAQLGGIKKRVADRVAGKPDTTVTAQAKPKCDATSIVITADLVDRYLESFTAREAELARLARERGETGQYWTAWLKRREIERRQREYKLHRGPDYQKYRAILTRLMSGDTTAAREGGQLEQELDPNRIAVPEVKWETQAQGNGRLDAAQREAGGFSECDWTNGVVERLPLMVLYLADASADGERLALERGTKAEVAAVRARVPELAKALEISYQTEAERLQLAREDSLATQRALESQLSPADVCAQRAGLDFAKKHKDELDAAQKQGDTAALMRLGLLMAQEQQKCYQ